MAPVGLLDQNRIHTHKTPHFDPEDGSGTSSNTPAILPTAVWRNDTSIELTPSSYSVQQIMNTLYMVENFVFRAL
jgi:hypothetical protein